MDNLKIGTAIAYLRKKMGYTQREVAERLGVSDKAVSKWERGLGVPDTSIIGKLAILLDTDTDSLLQGDIIHHNNDWTGLILLKRMGDDIFSGTIIYDKPLINYLLGYFILLGIKEIIIVCDKRDEEFIVGRYGLGDLLGIKLVFYNDIDICKNIKKTSNIMIVSGYTFIYGVDQTRFFQKAMLDKNRITVISLPKKKMDSPARIYYDSDKRIVTSENGDKLRTQYDYYQIPIIFCPGTAMKKMNFDERSFLKIDDDVYTVVLDRGFVEIPLNNWDDVMDASLFVKTVQKACGMQIYCIEEIAWRRGLISHDEFRKLGESYGDTPYGKYILDIAD